ncbi:MAG: tetratricopeptide repeat protein, partial [Candidatus Fermentibacteria bacterium]
MKTKTSNDISILEEKILQASTDSERGSAIAELACSVKYSDPERAVSLSDQVIELSLTADLKTVLPKCYLSKAIGLLHMSRFKVAEKSAKMGLTSCRQLDDQTGVRNALNVLASIYFRRSKYAAALEHYLESLEIHKQLTSTSDPGILSNIGAVYLQLGDTDRALDYFTQVKMLENEINESADLKASISLNMGRIYSRMGMYDDALEHLKEGYEIYLTNDMKQAAASTADSIGNAMMELGRYDEAMEHFKTAISSFTSFDDLKGEALVLSNMGKCCLLQESGKAMELYLESLKKFRFLRDSHGIAEALIGISLVMIDLGRNDVALDRLNEAYSIAEKEELKPQLSEIHKYLASILENEGKFDAAYQHLMIHSDIEKSLRSERVANSLINLRVINHTERTRKEMTTCLLRNIELEKEKDELEEILRLSEDEHKKDARGELHAHARPGPRDRTRSH